MVWQLAPITGKVPSLIKWSLITIMIRLKEIRYCSIVDRGSLRILAYHSFSKYWMQKIQKSWTKCVTTSPGLPYYGSLLKEIFRIHLHQNSHYLKKKVENSWLSVSIKLKTLKVSRFNVCRRWPLQPQRLHKMLSVITGKDGLFFKRSLQHPFPFLTTWTYLLRRGAIKIDWLTWIFFL